MSVSGHGGLLRARDGGEQQVTALELFFDLVFVFAVTQLSHRLLDHPTVGGALGTLLLLVALWWLYFARSAEAARRTFSSSEDPGRVAGSAYTYFHLPMIAGIIAVAAADELTVAHPGDRGTTALVALSFGGTALFLAGHALFKWAVFGVLSWPRLVAIAALIALIPVGFSVPALALGVAVALIAAALAAWDTFAERQTARPENQSTT